jgi:predicted O-methyltransferase YrrM
MQAGTAAGGGRVLVFLRQPRRMMRFRAGIRRRMQRRRLLRMLPKRGICAEIGTWKGDYAATILRSRRPKRLYLVDPWEYRTEEKYERSWFGRAGQDGMDAIHDAVIERFRAKIERGQVVITRLRSVEAAASFADATLDWVYIDADHSYEGVSADLEAYFSAVKPGGFLAGDDYRQGGWWGDGVVRAVDEFSEKRAAPLTIVGTQFLLTKP